jgi:hypothetical protein
LDATYIVPITRVDSSLDNTAFKNKENKKQINANNSQKITVNDQTKKSKSLISRKYLEKYKKNDFLYRHGHVHLQIYNTNTKANTNMWCSNKYSNNFSKTISILRQDLKNLVNNHITFINRLRLGISTLLLVISIFLFLFISFFN